LYQVLHSQLSMSVEVFYDTLYSDVRKTLEYGKLYQLMLSFSSYLTILNMDKVKYTLSGSVVNATFTFDDERVAPLTVNLNDMPINDGDVLAKQLYAYGQEYKNNYIARIPSQAVAGGQGMEFGYVDGVIVPIIPEVAPEVPVDPETPSE